MIGHKCCHLTLQRHPVATVRSAMTLSDQIGTLGVLALAVGSFFAVIGLVASLSFSIPTVLRGLGLFVRSHHALPDDPF